MDYGGGSWEKKKSGNNNFMYAEHINVVSEKTDLVIKHAASKKTREAQEGDSQEREAVLPRGKIGVGPAERGEETTASPEIGWVHVFNRPGIFETTQLPLPKTVHMFARTADWLNLLFSIYKILR